MGARGGKREGSGRKPKAAELKASALGIAAIEKTYGSIENYWELIAKKSKKSLPHLKLIHEYIYGRPVAVIDAKVETSIIIDMSEWQ